MVLAGLGSAVGVSGAQTGCGFGFGRCGTPQGRAGEQTLRALNSSHPTPEYTRHDAVADLCVDPIIALSCGLFSCFSDFQYFNGPE